jgi:hypothetical protein
MGYPATTSVATVVSAQSDRQRLNNAVDEIRDEIFTDHLLTRRYNEK